jgi:hypothetical protein
VFLPSVAVFAIDFDDAVVGLELDFVALFGFAAGDVVTDFLLRDGFDEEVDFGTFVEAALRAFFGDGDGGVDVGDEGTGEGGAALRDFRDLLAGCGVEGSLGASLVASSSVSSARRFFALNMMKKYYTVNLANEYLVHSCQVSFWAFMIVFVRVKQTHTYTVVNFLFTARS